ncbi:hypothetical protein KC19_VG209300 [Ceratodon purpureus]|nr:hypothetical protein KC19_VG209300 [Ceratodon purpureus]
MFSMSQVSVEVFGENPAAFGKELRRLRYPRMRTLDTVTLMRLAQLGIPPESANVTGATLLPPTSFLRILDDRRRMDLIPKVRAAMLKMITKEVTDLIIRGQFETALPIAMDAVQKAQALYWPREPLRMVPCYLLAVKVNLGLNRPVQSEDLLGVGSWLLLQDKSNEAKDDLRSEISQLFGRLSMLNKLTGPSLKAYAEEIYYKAREFGIYDVRTSIAFYNISRVFRNEKQLYHALAFWDVVIHSWRVALEELIMGVKPTRELPWGKKEFEGKNSKHLIPKEAIATLQMPEVCDMLQEICKFRSDELGRDDVAVGEACYVTGLGFCYANKKMLALEHLQRASEIMQQPNSLELKDFIDKAIEILLQPPPQPVLNSSPASPSSPASV